jgi:hypothetical protein
MSSLVTHIDLPCTSTGSCSINDNGNQNIKYDNNNNNDNDIGVTPAKINESHRTAITATTDDNNSTSFEQQQHHPLQSTTTTKSISYYYQQSSNSSIVQPPISRIEELRDVILRTLDTSIFQYIGILVLLGVIVSGALFFFLLLGWHNLCHPVTDCEPRNQIYNISIQILNGFFTYMAFVSFPWRLSNFFHLTHCRYCCCCCSCCGGRRCYPIRCNDVGHNVYGIPDPDIWFHIPVNRRLYITIILLFNCLFQFINHATRIENLTYQEQDVYPGNVWTNVFFVAAFVCAGIGAIWILYETSHLRKIYPNKFGYGPIDVMKHLYKQHFVRWLHQRRRHHTKRTDAKKQKVKDKDDAEWGVENNIDESSNEKLDSAPFEQLEVEFHQHERIVNSGGTDSVLSHNIQQQQQPHHIHHTHGTIPTNDMDDPTRATNHPTVLLKDRGAMRMFGL